MPSHQSFSTPTPNLPAAFCSVCNVAIMEESDVVLSACGHETCPEHYCPCIEEPSLPEILTGLTEAISGCLTGHLLSEGSQPVIVVVDMLGQVVHRIGDSSVLFTPSLKTGDSLRKSLPEDVTDIYRHLQRAAFQTGEDQRMAATAEFPWSAILVPFAVNYSEFVGCLFSSTPALKAAQLYRLAALSSEPRGANHRASKHRPNSIQF
jgi:hypothetical protein